MTATDQVVVQAYRDLYRHSLRAVQYATPQRYIIRDRLRRAFRESPRSDYEQARIDNTLRFFKAATQDTGIEHRLVKNLCHVWFHEPRQWANRNKKPKKEFTGIRVQAYDQFYSTLRMLNETMGLCLR